MREFYQKDALCLFFFFSMFVLSLRNNKYDEIARDSKENFTWANTSDWESKRESKKNNQKLNNKQNSLKTPCNKLKKIRVRLFCTLFLSFHPLVIVNADHIWQQATLTLTKTLFKKKRAFILELLQTFSFYLFIFCLYLCKNQYS